METRAPQGFVPLVAAVEPKEKRGSTATDLPKTKSVEPTADAAKSTRADTARDDERRANNEARADAAMKRSEMDVKTHAATGSLVLQSRDVETGELVHQFPNNATLKSRAIARYEAVQGTPTIKRVV